MANTLPNEMVKVCKIGGLEQKVYDVEKKISTLEDLEGTLVASIREANEAIKDEYFWRAMEVSAKIVAVSCDVAVAVIESSTGPAGKAVAAIYDASKLVVDAANGDLGFTKAMLYSTGAKLDGIDLILSDRGSKYAGAAGKIKNLVNVSYDLVDFVTDRGGDLTSQSGTIGARQTAMSQLHRIRLKISELKTALADCK